MYVITTVRGSGAVIASTAPKSAATPGALVRGSSMRSQVRFTAVESRGVPSWKRTSSRNVNVYRFALSSICHFVASSGRMFSESSRRMRGSSTLPMISSDAEPDGLAGSMSVFASH